MAGKEWWAIFHERFANEFSGDPGVAGRKGTSQAPRAGGFANVFGRVDFGTTGTTLGPSGA